MVLGTLALTAFLIARGVTTLVGGAIAPWPGGSAPRAAEAADRGDRAAMACAILARNAFDSTVGPIACDGEDTPEPTTVIAPDPGEPAACDGSLRLVATYVPRHDAGVSFASIRDASGRAFLYAAGMSIGGHEVSVIEPQRVELRTGDTACTLALFDRAPEAATARAALIATARPATEIPGVRAVGDRVEVSSSTISRAIADPMAFAGTMRALPTAGGLRLAGIRADHALASFGVRSGDVVRALDGAPLDGPDAWLGAMGAIARPGAHTLEIERGGRRVQLGVDVVP